MASTLVVINFPEQIKETRKKIQDSFQRSHEALRVRESTLLSRIDEIEKEYDSKTLEMRELIESLNNIKAISSNTLKSNKLIDTQNAVTKVINSKIAELTADIYSRMEFEWDTLFENNITQLGSINLNSPESTGHKMKPLLFKGSSQPPTQFPSANSSGIPQPNSQPEKLATPLFPTNQAQVQSSIFTPQSKQTTSLFPTPQQPQQLQQQQTNFGFPSPVIPGPSMFNADPSNPSTNLFNKQTNVFSPNQKSTFQFSATGNTPHTPTGPFAFSAAPQSNTLTTPQTPTYASFNIGSNQQQQQQQQPSEEPTIFNQNNKTILSSFQFNAISKEVPKIEPREPSKDSCLIPQTKLTPPPIQLPSNSSTATQRLQFPPFNQRKGTPYNSRFTSDSKPGAVHTELNKDSNLNAKSTLIAPNISKQKSQNRKL